VASPLTSHQRKAVVSFWPIFGRLAISDKGGDDSVLSDTTSVSDDGRTHTKMASTTFGSDGAVFSQMGSSISDGHARMVSTAKSIATFLMSFTTSQKHYSASSRSFY
jgi:hypothetical protein